MTKTMDYDGFTRILATAAALVQSEKDLLSKLDSHGGDGDHGPTMARAMDKLLEAMAGSAAGDYKALCTAIAWAIMGADGGSTGPLFGSLFLGMASVAPVEGALDAPVVSGMFVAGLAGVRKRTKAQVGDKTMMDALIPAVSALEASVGEGASIADAFAQAAVAAREGAEGTKEMQARFGRAKNIGEASKGEQDPGATSVALLFQGFTEGANQDA